MNQDSSTALPHTLTYTSDIVSAYLSKTPVAAGDMSGLIRSVHAALSGLSPGAVTETGALKPAIAIKRSVTPTFIVCLEDGKKLKMLKRYLRSHYDLTPEAYRAKWNLPHDYPMVAPSYSSLRSAFAKKFGLGTRPEKTKTRTKKRA